MNYSYETFKYDQAERQEKAIRQKMLGNRHQENRGKRTDRRR